MKQLAFIRHYKLAYPFDHWSNLTVKQFVNFTEGRIDPEIDQSLGKFLVNNPLSKTADLIICGSLRRSIQTAEIISKSFANNPPLISNQLFDEIPQIIMEKLSEPQFEAMKLNKKLQVKKKRVLNTREKLSRIMKIDNYLATLPESKILIVTHSYLIGLLNYWYAVIDRNRTTFNVNDAEHNELGGVLKGFTVRIPDENR